ncbi:MAG: adenine phosphoribosyltransferase [Alloprevotella sp.]|nr:adenine phosphoribosyltransferase [Alloprevotella sp.]
MNEELLRKHLRVIPDYPKKGIMFQDVSTLFKDAECLKELKNELVRLYADKGITKVVGVESRGFVLGSILAAELGAGFVMARKPGKLPANTIRAKYRKEYGFDSIEVHADAINEDDVLLLHDDLLATGGSMQAVYDLCSHFHPKKIYINFIFELNMEGLEGLKNLGPDKDVTVLMKISE